MMSMMMDIAASSRVVMLKCDVVPRAACVVMQTIWVSTQTETPQLMVFFPQFDRRRYSSNRATVYAYRAMERANLIGLIQGLMPVTSRESKGKTTSMQITKTRLNQTVVARTLSRR